MGNYNFFRIQEERSERHKYKNVLRDRGVVGVEPVLDMIPDVGSYDTGDPNTTNLYLGNLNPKVNKNIILQIYLFYRAQNLPNWETTATV